MNISTKLSLLAFASTNLIFGTLMPLGLQPLQGTGIGTVRTALVLSSPGSTSTETGCVGFAGGTITGPSACPTGFVGGNEQTGQNFTYAVVDFNLPGFSFNNLQLIFNAIEPGNPATQSITVDALAITLWNPTTGALIETFRTDGAYPIADPAQGAGQSGYAFALDAAQATAANLRLAATPNLRIGVAANASNAQSGFDTVFLRTVVGGGGGVPPSQVIPEPGTYALVGFGLISAAYVGRRKVK